MTESTLTATSFTVLGMVAEYGPVTSYELKKIIDGSAGYFWSFPRAQLYVEPERLESLGLLESHQEEIGRRRRLYSVTPAGLDALRDWIQRPDDDRPQYRDPGLLRLFFAGTVSNEAVGRLAQRQIAAHEMLLAEYHAIDQVLREQPDQRFAAATVRLGIMTSETAITFWRDILDKGPGRPGAR